jgi:HPt (histidine-containing phosphotransfer) domain-containing protein
VNDSPRTEFFAREAGDYLQQLEPLVRQPAPSPEAILRLARALRGAAMLAGPQTFTQAASQLEQLAKRLGEGNIGWDTMAPPLRLAVEQLRRLAGAARAWDAEHDRQAVSVADALRALGSAATSPEKRDEVETRRQAGRRAFVAREAAATAGAAELAARALAGAAAVPSDRLGMVSRAMQSLRGLADLAEFDPLPALLDAVDAALSELALAPVPPPGAADFFFAAAGALARVGRDVATRGALDADMEEAQRVADLLHRMLCGPGALVPIEHLLAAPAPEPTTKLPVAEPAELVGVGERLRHAAVELRRARSRGETALAAVTLLAWLRHARRALGRRPTDAFLRRLLATLESSVDPPGVAALADLLDRAGFRLVSGPHGDLDGLAAELRALAAELETVGAPPPLPGVDAEVIPIEELLETEPVPIESLAPDRPEPASDRTVLERSLSTYSRLKQATGSPAAGATLTAVLERRDLGPRVSDSEAVVPIESLLYSGRGALLRADAIRRELETALRTRTRSLEQVEPLVRELLDLVPLALADDR